jgi:hypothetical protein
MSLTFIVNKKDFQILKRGNNQWINCEKNLSLCFFDNS